MLRAFAIIALTGTGCLAHTGDEGMVVLNNTAITGMTCALMGTSGQAFQTQGMISVFSPSPYVLTPFIQSRITSTGGDDSQRTIELEGARIDLRVAAATVQHPDGTYTSPAITLSDASSHFAELFSGNLPPMGTANVGFGLVPTTAIGEIRTMAGAGPTDRLNATVTASVVIYGTMGGNEIDSNPFQYPVTVCNNCIVNNLGACLGLTTTMVRTGNPCNPFQDGVVDCCTDAGGGFVCPAVATM